VQHLRLRIDGEEFVVGCETAAGGELCLLLNGRPQVLHVRTDSPGRYRVSLAGGETLVELRDPLAARLASAAPGVTIRQAREIEIHAPMPGVVFAVHAREGEEVAAGAPLVVLEAMKMQNALASPAAGIVRSVRVTPGQAVDGEALLVVLERLDLPGGPGAAAPREGGAT
jgi:acetyl-CoA/propionyl-CoA carboxylase biotin carboxyl carrier protein